MAVRSGWEPALACRPPVGDLASFAIGGPGRGAIGCFGLPKLLDAVRRQLSGGIPLGGRGEGLFAGQVSELELGVVVAVAHDVSMVGVATAGHAYVQRRRGGSWRDDDVAAVDGAASGAGDGGGVPSTTSVATYPAGSTADTPRRSRSTWSEPSPVTPVTVHTSRFRMRWPSLVEISRVLRRVRTRSPMWMRRAVGGVGDVAAETAGDPQVVLAAGADIGGVTGGIDHDERTVTGSGVGPPGRGGVVEHGVAARLDDPTFSPVGGGDGGVAGAELQRGVGFPGLTEPAHGGELDRRRQRGEIPEQAAGFGCAHLREVTDQGDLRAVHTGDADHLIQHQGGDHRRLVDDHAPAARHVHGADSPPGDRVRRQPGLVGHDPGCGGRQREHDHVAPAAW